MEKKEDVMVDKNNYIRALRYAHKKLTKEISQKMLEATRAFGTGNNAVLVLGRNHASLLNHMIRFQSISKTGKELDISKLNLFNRKESIIEVYNLPVYVSTKLDVVEVYVGLAPLVNTDPPISLDDPKPLLHLDTKRVLEELPEEFKLKQVATKETE